jgi:hypothetical protein
MNLDERVMRDREAAYNRFDADIEEKKKASNVIPWVWETPTYKIIPLSSISAYPGLMDAVVKSVLHVANKPQPELTILSALIGMAAAIGGNYKLPGGGRMNLYGVGISETGTGKDKAMLGGVCVAGMGGADSIGQPGSGAALEDALSEYGTKLLLNIDEAAHFIAAMNDNKQTHMASLSGNLLKLYSASSHKYTTRKLANSSMNEQKTCFNPCVSLLGFACPEKLGAAFGGSSNVDDGLMGRILFVNGRDGVKPRRSRSDIHFHSDIIDIGKAINNAREITVSFSSDADAHLDVLIDEFDSFASGTDNPFAKNLRARSFEKCERIAGVLAVWDDPDRPVITLSHVLWAESFVKYSDSAILKFTSNYMHGGKVQADAAKVLSIFSKFRSGDLKATKQLYIDAMAVPGCYPRTSILKASHMDKKEFDAAIEHLIDLREIHTGVSRFGDVEIKMLFKTY